MYLGLGSFLPQAYRKLLEIYGIENRQAKMCRLLGALFYGVGVRHQ